MRMRLWMSSWFGLAVVAMVQPVWAAPLRLLPPDQIPCNAGLDAQLWQHPDGSQGDKATLLQSIDHSLRYLDTSKAAADYQKLSVPGVTRDRVRRSLQRFRSLVQGAESAAALSAAVQREFTFYQAVGTDNAGRVEFTGYFEPTYRASRQPTADYRYPIYRAPSGFSAWAAPHPTRAQLEGVDGLQASKGPLKGRELVWLRDRLEAYLIQVQGSARLTLTDGSVMSVGFAGKTQHPYTSLGKELVKEGKVALEDLSLPWLMQYFEDNPADLDRFIPRNQSFVFFQETFGAPATGSIGVPVMAERSIATDKTLMPPGALALIHTRFPYAGANQTTEFRDVSHFVLDQDTGSAIKGPGRVDIFMGTGNGPKARAGLINTPGQLYYLLLKQ